MEEINDISKWGAFVEKLIIKTANDQIIWSIDTNATRDDSNGPIYSSLVNDYKYIAIYRSIYRYYFDEDEYEFRNDITVQIVDHMGEILWRLPSLAPAKRLIDLIEFELSDAQSLLDDF